MGSSKDDPQDQGAQKAKGVSSTHASLKARPGYEVGYARPPAATRFVKGQSGNPAGRPKGAKSKRPGLSEERMKTILLDEAYRTITVRDGDRNVTVPMAQAVLRALAVNAAKGQHRSQRLFTELLTMVEAQNRRLHDAWMETAITYKVEWGRELDRRARLGITGPTPLPHPDHVLIDIREGTARISGPATPEEKVEYDRILRQKASLVELLANVRERLEDETDPEEIAILQGLLKTAERALAQYWLVIPD